MRISTRSLPIRAVTLIECLVVLAVLCLLCVVLLSPYSGRRASGSRISCVNNLKNVGLSFQLFANDNGDLSFRVPESGGGTARYAEQPAELWRHFAAHSYQLSTPKDVACPRDTRRSLINTWECVATNDRNGAISYTLGLEASINQPDSILSSDRNLSLDELPVGLSVLRLGANSSAGFYTNIHNRAGNLLLGDGSVQQVTSRGLREEIAQAVRNQTNTGTIRIVIP